MSEEPIEFSVDATTWTFPSEGKVISILDGPRSGVDVLEQEVRG